MICGTRRQSSSKHAGTGNCCWSSEFNGSINWRSCFLLGMQWSWTLGTRSSLWSGATRGSCDGWDFTRGLFWLAGAPGGSISCLYVGWLVSMFLSTSFFCCGAGFGCEWHKFSKHLETLSTHNYNGTSASLCSGYPVALCLLKGKCFQGICSCPLRSLQS